MNEKRIFIEIEEAISLSCVNERPCIQNFLDLMPCLEDGKESNKWERKWGRQWGKEKIYSPFVWVGREWGGKSD